MTTRSSFDPQNRPKQLDSPLVAALIKWSSRANTVLYKATRGRIGGTWRVGAALHKPAPVCLLTTTGRNSGKARTTPLLFLRRGDVFVIVGSRGGAAHHPAWYLNLCDNPEVTIQLGNTSFDLTARTASENERAELWPDLIDVYADFDTYVAWTAQGATKRTIPVVICEPR